MAGALIPLWSARQLDFSGLAPGSPAQLVMSGPVDLLPYREAVFLIRVHAVELDGAGAMLDFIVHPSAPSHEDRSNEFVNRSVELARIPLAGAVDGELLRAVLPPAFGASVHVFAIASHTASASPPTIEARVSAAILGRR